MKKNLLSVCLFTALCAGVSNAQSIRQVEKLSDNNLNYFHYSYNDKNKIDSVYQEITADQYSSYTLFTYDENGNNVKKERHQMSKDMNDYLFTDYVDFVYNEDRLITRKNYNFDMFGGTNKFLLGGVYVYEYNMDKQLTKRSLYWDEEKTRLYETVAYQYDNKGRLTKDTRSTDQFGQWVEDFQQQYEYDKEGRLIKITTLGLDYTTGGLAVSNWRTFEYDQQGNLIKALDFLGNGTVSVQHEYAYNTEIEAANTVFPVDIDESDMLFKASKNVISEDVIHMLDIKVGKLVYVDTEIWVYEDTNNLGINTVENTNGINVLSLNNSVLELGNVAKGENVRVYDISGKIVYNVNYNNGINISNLSEGVYMVVTKDNCIKIRK